MHKFHSLLTRPKSNQNVFPSPQKAPEWWGLPRDGLCLWKGSGWFLRLDHWRIHSIGEAGTPVPHANGEKKRKVLHKMVNMGLSVLDLHHLQMWKWAAAKLKSFSFPDHSSCDIEPSTKPELLNLFRSWPTFTCTYSLEQPQTYSIHTVLIWTNLSHWLHSLKKTMVTHFESCPTGSEPLHLRRVYSTHQATPSARVHLRSPPYWQKVSIQYQYVAHPDEYLRCYAEEGFEPSSPPDTLSLSLPQTRHFLGTTFCTAT